jgi:FAD/FMN-containing dehydrogenase/Fe-S oxidoreductase
MSVGSTDMTTHVRTEAPDVSTRSLLRPRHPQPLSSGTSSVDVVALAAELRRAIRGDVLTDAGSLGLHAQDASNYFQVPLAVVVPRSREDVLAAVAVCRAHAAPITCRGGGTALAGQTCNQAVVLDFSRYLTRILQLDPQSRLARVEPGVICDALVEAARPHGLTWGPKPATHDRCCFGGMLANNCGGMEAQRHGIASSNVESLEVLLYDGTVMQVGFMSEEEFERAGQRPGREGEVYRQLFALRARTADRIRERFPQIPRRVSGYNLDQLLPSHDGRINVARALVGSEGTCAIILSAEVQLLPVPAYETVVAVGFPDVYAAADAVPAVLGFQPLVCEGIDQRLVENIREKHTRHARYLPLLPEGRAWLLLKLGAETREQLEREAQALCGELRASEGAISARVYDEIAEQEGLWKLRESGLGATAFVPGDPDAWPGWEDSAVAPEQLGDYLRDLRALYEKYRYNPALYGHFGQGLVHCRVQFDLTSAQGLADYRSFLREAAELCTRKYTGSLSGEHGDGQARGELLDIMFGSELVEAFRDFKRIWDPLGGMNPGKLVDAYPITANLRLGASYDPAQPQTHFKFPQDQGSFARATLRCVGVGKCRRTSAPGETPDDVMCPSYMVTLDEKHSTRGRAHLLWEMMRGGDSPIRGGFRDEHVKESLDLCLACKGCKNDCPVNVDMATYKAEFLAHYWRGRVRPRHAFAFGLIDKWARLATIAPGLVNLLTHARPSAAVAKWLAGMASERDAPRFAPETFVSWWKRRGPSAARTERVVLWPDTFNNHFHTDTARAAVEVLEHAGYEVIVPEMAMCCGRPLYDFGFLGLARRYLERVLTCMRPWIEQGLPVVVLEPSCASTFRDELVNLMPARLEAQRLSRQTKLLSELLIEREVKLPKLRARAIVQGHCHHKAAIGFEAESQLLHALELDADLLSAGCCGMAGAFGFERDADKQRVSRQCGERVLFGAIRAAPAETLIIANGFSCQTQIEAGTDRRAIHVAQALKLAYDSECRPPPVAAQRARARRPERLALLGLGCIAAGAVAAGLAYRAHAASSLR